MIEVASLKGELYIMKDVYCALPSGPEKEGLGRKINDSKIKLEEAETLLNARAKPQ